MTRSISFVAASVLVMLLASCGDSNPPIMGDNAKDPTNGDGKSGTGGKDPNGSGKTDGAGGSGGGSANTGGSVADSGTPEPTPGKCGDVTCIAPATCEADVCVCPDGYDADGTGCTDIDECAKKNGGCDTLTECTNTDGGRTCGDCPDGYTGDGESGCVDIDECAKKNGGCDTLTECTNTDGGRTCGDCPDGYTGDGVAGCTDINECDTDNGGCDALTTCTNTDGGRTCSACPSGYSGDGVAGCDDINECLTSNGGCDALTTCTNIIGAARTCSACPIGYDGTGADGCTNINECVTANDCSVHASCADSTPGYACTCIAPAYTGVDGKVCTCANGYADVGGGVCKADNGTACGDDTACVGGNCVSGICCSTKCASPPTCKVAAAATCNGGTTCVYANASNTTPCNDNSVCTQTDLCTNGTCTGTNPQNCSDNNICTIDTCDPVSGCSTNGTGVTVSCASDLPCEKAWKCQGNVAGDCGPTNITNCDNVSDQCNAGVCDPNTGNCMAMPVSNGLPCTANTCFVGQTCQNGTCSLGSARDCSDSNVCTTDSCDASLGCKNVVNTIVCDDGDACTGTVGTPDRCSAGSCAAGAAKDCSAFANACNAGQCQPNGTCASVPLPGLACNDSIACTSAETCSAGGVCVDLDTDSACGTGSTSCSGNPRTCVCGVGFVFDVPTRTCKPNVCEPNPCSANATCSAPGSTAVCTCNAGYQDTNANADPVTGVTCTDIDECAVGTPCAGLGACTQNPTPGQGYSCACNSGFQSVDGTDDGINNPSCACNLNGTYAVKVTANVTWPAITNFAGTLISAGAATTNSWAIRQHVYDASGTLQVVTTPCGGSTPDLCSPYFNEAYAQFLSSYMWQQAAMPVQNETMALPGARPSTAFQTAMSAVLLGINLPAPGWVSSDATDYGWPNGRANVGSNGSSWNDPDADSISGVSTYAVPPGGAPLDGAPDPNFAYPAASSYCGRNYAYWPTDPSVQNCGGPFTSCRITRFSLASRVISAYKGSFTASCDRITGDVIGPDPDGIDSNVDKDMRTDARFNDCALTTGACSAATRDWLDGQAQTQKLGDATFVIKRVDAGLLAGGLTCAEVRGMNFN